MWIIPPFGRFVYRWWTVGIWIDSLGPQYATVKLGPCSFTLYRWFDGRNRLGLNINDQREIILWGGPLA